MIYILLPVHNRRAITEKLIRCLCFQTSKCFKIVLIDDGSTDGTDQMVLSYFPETVVLKGGGDLWWAGSLELGYRWLNKQLIRYEDNVLIINDDTEIDPEYLENGISLLAQNKKTAFLSFCYDSKNKSTLIDIGTKVSWPDLSISPTTQADEINCLSTRGLFMNATDFLLVGGFYPKILPHYLSDYEFTIRASKKGIALKSDDSIKVWVDTSTTGFHTLKDKNNFVFLSKFFSKKNPVNPFYFSVFIILACPLKNMLQNIIKINWIGIKKIILNWLNSFKAS